MATTTKSMNYHISPGGKNAYRVVLNYIRANGLKPGDRLPGHDKLRRSLKLGNNTLSEAIQLMAADGVVTSVRRSRTVIADLSSASVPLWRVAVVASPRPSGIHSLYNLFLRQELIINNCQDVSFVPPNDYRQLEHPFSIAKVNNLEQEVKLNNLDAIISFYPLAPCAIPILNFTSGPDDWGVKIDIKGMIDDGIKELKKHGCQRLLVISTGDHPEEEPVENGNYSKSKWNGFECLSARKLGPGTKLGLALAKDLLARPEEQRPQGIVCSDDFTAQGLSIGIAAKSEWRPIVAVRSNTHLPISYFLPVITLGLDPEKLAKAIVAKVVEVLLNPNAKRELTRVAYHDIGQLTEGLSIN